MDVDRDAIASNISSQLCIKHVHCNMHFNANSSNYNTGEIVRTWHPTLCSSLDYRYVYRIGGGDACQGLMGAASDSASVFDVHTMSYKNLPRMTHKRAYCAATLLPPTVPFHEYDESQEDEQHAANVVGKAPSLSDIFLTHFKNSKLPPPPMPPVFAAISDDNSAEMPSSSTTHSSMKPVSNLPAKHAPIALSSSDSSPTTTPPSSNSPKQAPAPVPISIGKMATNVLPTPPPLTTKNVSISDKISIVSPTTAINYGGRSRRNSRFQAEESQWPNYCVFVCGGLDGDTLLQKCEIFYPLEGAWNPVRRMKQARCAHIAQYMGSSHWRYQWRLNGVLDIDILKWKDVSDLTTKIFVCGGKRDHGHGITSCEVFDIESDAWSVCQRAPFTNHGTQSSGCWWSTKKCVAMMSDVMDGNRIALYRPDVNQWQVIGKATNKVAQLKRSHLNPVIGTLQLMNNEYLFLLSNELEIYDERSDQW
eukprot:CAMPEP_0202726544 /NCGR_PEP_ID=MMETSP1385-20130828/184665_1 /ASSEMBLY_ACC=CAM_ASM_000861 /TAXON_ID=933848 /ORGANISM="Elphidium margaritaceum" /LENGTH=476 /DNA_ID=CAMNT_0049392765 /DNA_START=289 /DNA_END=1716 /DNA_ORIENTATION=+